MRFPTFLILNSFATTIVLVSVFVGVNKVFDIRSPEINSLIGTVTSGGSFLIGLEIYLRSPLSKKMWDED